MRRILCVFSIGTLLTLASACDSTAPRKSVEIDLPGTVALQQGETRSLSVNVRRTNVDGIVRLSITSTVPGLTADFAVDSMLAGENSFTLELLVHRSALPANGTVSITASADGIEPASAQSTVTIAMRGSFTLGAVDPVLAAQGGAGMAAIPVTRVDGNGSVVTLTASGLPTGVSAAPATTDYAGAVLWLVASNAAPTGRHTITVTGTAEALPPQTTQVTLDVIGPPSTASVTIGFCGSAPQWAGYRNEGYGWRRLTPSGLALTFDATERLSVAYVFGQGGFTRLNVLEMSRAELAQWTISCEGTKSVSGTFADLPATHQGVAAMNGFEVARTSTSPAFTLTRLPDGALDLIASRGMVASSQYAPDLFVARRGLNVASGGALPPIDFAAEGVAPQLANVSAANMPANEQPTLELSLRSALGTDATVHARDVVSAAAVSTPHFPASLFQSGDLHEFVIDAGIFTQAPLRLRGATAWYYFADVADRTLNLSSKIAPPVIDTLALLPVPRPRATLSPQGVYTGLGMVIFISPNGAREILVAQSAAYLGSAPSTWRIAVPDFSGVEGFSTTWLTAGSRNYAVEAMSPPAELFVGAPGEAGDVLQHSLDYFLPDFSVVELRERPSESGARFRATVERQSAQSRRLTLPKAYRR